MISFNGDGNASYISMEEINFSELVGAISEGVYWCSYNDDTVLCAALTGTINSDVSRLDSVEKKRFLDMVPDVFANTTHRDGLIISLMRSTGGWASCWDSAVEHVSDLPENYSRIFYDCKQTKLYEELNALNPNEIRLRKPASLFRRVL